MKLNAGTIIGLVGGLVGGGIGLAAAFMADPLVGAFVGGFLLLMFFIMYRAFIKPSMEYSRLIKTGIPGTGTVLSISETGTRINNQPLCKIELQVTIPGKPSYNTVTKTVISYLQAAQFQPGTQVPIMVDPKNNMKVVLIRQGDVPNANPLANASPEQVAELKQKLEEMEKVNQDIRSTGIYCKAIVTKYTAMGVNVNGDNPLVTMEVQVLPDNEPAFAGTVKCVIKNTSIPLYQPGEEIFVKYDQYDKSKVAVEHS